MMRTRWRTRLTGAAIFVIGLAIFLTGIEIPAHPYFDEVHYLPAAKELLALPRGARPVLNREHPPLAKELMAAGIAVWGDTPWGWRFMSALFGAIALVALYFWTLALFGDPAPALWATALTLADQFLYVEARIATLDVFMAAFTLCALAAFTASWREGAPVRALMLATGIFLGLATACKWTGLFTVALWLVVLAAVAVLRRWRVRFDEPRATDWFRPELWAAMRAGDWILCLGAPVVVYAATFLPITGLSLPDLVRLHAVMWHDQASLSIAGHPYASAWFTWPVLARPIWFLFEPDAAVAGAYRAIVFLGNPVVFWCGIPALIACLGAFVRSRRFDAFMIGAAFASLYFAWAVVPRGLGFLYYYFPAGLAVGPALAFAFYRTVLGRYPVARWLYLALAVASFAYFLPISSAAMTVTLPSYNQLMWFPSWR